MSGATIDRGARAWTAVDVGAGKASQKFVDLEGHDLHVVVVGVILPAKPDVAVSIIDEPIIRERDAVGVPPKIVEDLLRAGEGPFRIHDPVKTTYSTYQLLVRFSEAGASRVY